MTDKGKDLAWRCLPKVARDEIKYEYNHTVHQPVRYSLTCIFGHDNLTSNTEPEEMICAPLKAVRHVYDTTKDGKMRGTLHALFGNKCLPDDFGKEDNFPTKPPKHVSTEEVCELIVVDKDEATKLVLTEENYNNKSAIAGNTPESKISDPKENELSDWDKDFKRMNEIFNKMQKTLSRFYDSYGAMCSAYEKIKRL